MKKINFLLLLFFLMVSLGFARDFTNLKPPSIAVIDFINNTGSEELGGKNLDQVVNIHGNEWGQILSQALLSALIQQNNYHYAFPAKKCAIIGEFPVSAFPLLKIIDKKYVEEALADSKYSVSDYYRKSGELFQIAELDFLVIGNIYESQLVPPNKGQKNAAETRRQNDKDGLKEKQDFLSGHIRVLNLKRGEEIFSYNFAVQRDFKDLKEIFSNLAYLIVGNILKSQKTNFQIAVSEEIFENERNTAENSLKEIPLRVFFRPKRIINQENIVEPSNDTHYIEILINPEKDAGNYNSGFLSFLPGDYELLVYHKLKDSISQYDIKLNAREYNKHIIKKEDFKTQSSTITINNVKPTDNFSLYLEEKEQSLKYFWEVSQGVSRQPKTLRFQFRAGNIENINSLGLVSINGFYDSYNNQVVIEGIIPSVYQLRILQNSRLSVSGVTGIQKYSINAVRSTEPQTINLEKERQVTLSFQKLISSAEKRVIPKVSQPTRSSKEEADDEDEDEDEDVEGDKPEEEEIYRPSFTRERESDLQKIKISFIFNPGFNYKEIKMYLDKSKNFISIKDTQKIILEESYLQSEWKKLSYEYIKYRFEVDGLQTVAGIITKKDIERDPDKIIIIDFTKVKKAEPVKSAEEESHNPSFTDAGKKGRPQNTLHSPAYQGNSLQNPAVNTISSNPGASSRNKNESSRSQKTAKYYTHHLAMGGDGGGSGYGDFVITYNIMRRKSIKFAMGLDSAFKIGGGEGWLADDFPLNLGGLLGIKFIWGPYIELMGGGLSTGVAWDMDLPGPYIGGDLYFKSFFMNLTLQLQPFTLIEYGVPGKIMFTFGYAFSGKENKLKD